MPDVASTPPDLVSSDFCGLLSLLSGPGFILLMLLFYLVRRKRPLPTPLFAAIPLALTSVSLQLVGAVLIILRGFEGMASQKVTGAVAIFTCLVESRQSVMWRVVEVATCIVLVALFQWIQYARGDLGPKAPSAEPSNTRSNVSTAAMGYAALAAILIGYLVWLAADISYFVVLLIDRSKVAEAQARISSLGIDFSSRGIGPLAAYVSNRLVLLSLAALVSTLVLLVAGCRCLEPDRPRRMDAGMSTVLAAAVLLWCALSTASAREAVLYMRNQITSRGQTPPSWRLGLVPFAETDFESLLPAPEPLPPTGLTEPPPPPPPPPPHVPKIIPAPIDQP